MSARDRYYASPLDGADDTMRIKVERQGHISAQGINYGLCWETGGAEESARRQALSVVEGPGSSEHQVLRARTVLAWLDLTPEAREDLRVDPPGPPSRIDIVDGGHEISLDGRLWWSSNVDARPLTGEWARRIADSPTTDDPDTWLAVADALDNAAHVAAHAERVGPPVTGPVPAPPARPRVRLRTEVEVDGLPAVDLAVYVHPSAVDTATAVTAAARALHDAALAAAHVLVVEPADPAGRAS